MRPFIGSYNTIASKGTNDTIFRKAPCGAWRSGRSPNIRYFQTFEHSEQLCLYANAALEEGALKDRTCDHPSSSLNFPHHMPRDKTRFMRYHPPANVIQYSPLRQRYGYPLPSRSAIEVSVALSYLAPAALSVPMLLSVSCA